MSGIERVIIGLVKKVAIADPLSVLVDKMFVNDPAQIIGMPAAEVVLAAFLFGFQIYLDFSAYSDIAIGSARMMGIRFPENFNWPYLSRSPREFWQRWHISLSSWIRDYVYLPMQSRAGGVRSVGGLNPDEGRDRRLGALVLTWFVMGLWHGANWTFALWGLYHALVLIVFRQVHRLGWSVPGRLGDVLGWAVTLPVMMLGWLFFRAVDLQQLGLMLERLVTPSAYGMVTSHRGSYFVVVAMLGAGMLALKLLGESRTLAAAHWHRPLGWAGYVGFFAALLVAVIVFLQPVNQFIYFQF